jgi:hypothetical protein
VHTEANQGKCSCCQLVQSRWGEHDRSRAKRVKGQREGISLLAISTGERVDGDVRSSTLENVENVNAVPGAVQGVQHDTIKRCAELDVRVGEKLSTQCARCEWRGRDGEGRQGDAGRRDHTRYIPGAQPDTLRRDSINDMVCSWHIRCSRFSIVRESETEGFGVQLDVLVGKRAS